MSSHQNFTTLFQRYDLPLLTEQLDAIASAELEKILYMEKQLT